MNSKHDLNAVTGDEMLRNAWSELNEIYRPGLLHFLESKEPSLNATRLQLEARINTCLLGDFNYNELSQLLTAWKSAFYEALESFSS